MSECSRAAWAAPIVLAFLTIGTAFFTYSVFVLAQSLPRVGSQFLGEFLTQFVQGLVTLACLLAALEVANIVILWATQGPIPSLIQAAWRLSAWGVG